MVKKFLKFIERSPYKDRLLKVIEEIYHDTLEGHDLKQIQ